MVLNLPLTAASGPYITIRHVLLHVLLELGPEIPINLILKTQAVGLHVGVTED